MGEALGNKRSFSLNTGHITLTFVRCWSNNVSSVVVLLFHGLISQWHTGRVSTRVSSTAFVSWFCCWRTSPKVFVTLFFQPQRVEWSAQPVAALRDPDRSHARATIYRKRPTKFPRTLPCRRTLLFSKSIFSPKFFFKRWRSLPSFLKRMNSFLASRDPRKRWPRPLNRMWRI